MLITRISTTSDHSSDNKLHTTIVIDTNKLDVDTEKTKYVNVHREIVSKQ